MKKRLFQHIYDFIGIPLRMIILPDKWSGRIGLTSMEDERVLEVLPEIEGKLLDIGCGNNRLVHEYENGIGVDVYKWSDDIVIVKDSSSLPFENKTFDTITFLACLNHIPNRTDVLNEAKRLLKENGKVIMTMINPILGYIGHKIWWYAEDRERGMHDDEVGGIWNRDIINLFKELGFMLEKHKRFLYGMNNMLIFRKKNEA